MRGRSLALFEQLQLACSLPSRRCHCVAVAEIVYPAGASATPALDRPFLSSEPNPEREFETNQTVSTEVVEDKLCLEDTQYKTLSAAAGVAYEGARHLSRS